MAEDNILDININIIDKTTLAGEDYLLALDAEHDDTAYILKQTGEEDGDVIYEFVEDDNILKALMRLFKEQSDDIDFEIEDEEDIF